MEETASSGEVMKSPSPPYPVKEVAREADKALNLFYFLGLATAPSGTYGKKDLDRSLGTRIARANLLKELQKTRIERKKERGHIFDKLKREEINKKTARKELEELSNPARQKSRQLDEFDKQFLNQQPLTIDLGPLGKQTAYYAVVDLPPGMKKEKDLPKPPIFIIPAFSGDLYGIEPLIRELVLQGRRVISIAYPESLMGTTTEEFAAAVEKSGTYDPHTTFFKQAIKALCGTEGKLELWGYSTGAAIVPEILTDVNFQERVQNAVVLCLGSSVNQSKNDLLVKGGLQELAYTGLVVLKNLQRLADISYVHGKKDGMEEKARSVRDRISNALLQKVCKKSEFWSQAKVNEGEFLFVVGGNDGITKARNLVNDPQLRKPPFTFVYYPQGSHLFPLTEAGYLVEKVLSILDKTETGNRVIQI